MASLVNTYFIKGHAGEQNLIQQLIDESIQINGHTLYYLPRILQKLDIVFGEDVLSKFDTALPIEMYVDNPQGWEGEQELISKFGLEIRKHINLTISRVRWTTEVKKIADKMWVSVRPQEGDLIYDPQSKMLFEIKFVDQDEVFLQGYKYYTYALKCEMFQFNQENFTTGIPAIDNNMFTEMSNLQPFRLQTATGTNLIANNNYMIIKDLEENIFDTSKHFKSQAAIIEFDVTNPFGGM